MRSDAQRDVEDRLRRGHLEIERFANGGLQPAHVVVVDMTAVLAQMRGDSVGPGVNRYQRRSHRVGDSAATGIADGRDVIDIHAQSKRWHCGPSQKATWLAAIARLPGLTAGSAASSGGSASGG